MSFLKALQISYVQSKNSDATRLLKFPSAPPTDYYYRHLMQYKEKSFYKKPD